MRPLDFFSIAALFFQKQPGYNFKGKMADFQTLWNARSGFRD